MGFFSKSVCAVILLVTTSVSYTCDTLTVNGADHWYPYFSRHNSQHLGIMGDIVTRAADRAGIKIDLRPSVPWKRVLFNLGSGQLDIIAGALKTQQREKKFNFSDAIHFAELRVFVRWDRRFDFRQMSDLVGKTGGKVRGMSLGEKADEYSFNNLVIDDVPSPKSLFQMVASGRLEYGIFYGSTGKQEIEKYNLTSTIEILPGAVATEGLYIAFSKNSQCQSQITLLNNEIKKMKKDGNIEPIIQYYHTAVASQGMEGNK
jgi:polar amino acid transport system substrate-binding protein